MTRTEFKQYCLRRLGAPVLQINVADEQIEDRIDDALIYFKESHFDGTEHFYLAITVTETDIQNGFVVVPDNIESVVRIFGTAVDNGIMHPMNDTSLSYNFNMFSPLGMSTGGISTGDGESSYQEQAGGGFDMVNYYFTMTGYEFLKQMVNREPPLSFNRVTNKLYIDFDWTKFTTNPTLVLEVYGKVNENMHPDIWEDRWLRNYATALIKKQWGMNLSKYQGISLPGGVTLDGQTILQEANSEIEKLEQEMLLSYAAPMQIFIG